MSVLGQIVNQAVAQEQAALQVQVAVGVLKQTFDVQEEAVLKLRESMGIGQNIDTQA